jgi:hypothetical protein
MSLSPLRAEIREEIDHAFRFFSTAQRMRGFASNVTTSIGALRGTSFVEEAVQD